MAGNDNITKLYIIVLFEANFNNNNKWLGRAVMKSVESHGLMAIKQYGSRKSKAAGSQCLNKWLFFDLFWFLRRPVVLCSNDAKSCYNQIVLIITALCLCQLGTTKETVHRMIYTLANLPPHTNIIWWFQDSPRPKGLGLTSCRDWAREWGWPTNMGSSKLPIIQHHVKEGLVVQFICALSKQHCAMTGFAFVDNTDLIVNNTTNMATAVHDKMQQSLTLWHVLLWATGGDLVLDNFFGTFWISYGNRTNGNTNVNKTCQVR